MGSCTTKETWGGGETVKRTAEEVVRAEVNDASGLPDESTVAACSRLPADEFRGLLVAVATGTARERHRLVCVGDTVRVKTWVTDPMHTWGRAKPGETGTVVAVLGKLLCKVDFPEHQGWLGYAPEMEVIGGGELSSGHAGQWRCRAAGSTKHCSTPGSEDGLLCAHGGGETPEDHWSCCGQTQLHSSCGRDRVEVGDVVASKHIPGDRGVVLAVDGQDVRVSFESAASRRSCLTLQAAGLNVVHRFTVGTQVTVRSDVDEPQLGWGTASRGDVGLVACIDAEQGVMAVAFPHENKWVAWTGLLTDMEVAEDVPGQLKPGDRVRVKEWETEPASGWRGVRPGDVGVVMRVDQLECEVWFERQLEPWQGYLPELEVLDGRGHHSGMWRPSTSKFICSTADAREGPLCEHGSEHIDEEHWSCCGSTELASVCRGGGIRVGDVVQVKQSTREPMYAWGEVRRGDRGVVREYDPVTGIMHVSFPQRQRDLWVAHGPEMEIVARFAEGQRVTVRPDIQLPHHSWGAIKRGDVGQVRCVAPSADGLVVDFPQQAGWRARMTEMKIVQ
eukprot:TRINITY_DN9318_c0_g1_i1.p1 TRINITY_DN9318_c0_g1~~TRINITY_DN9318_c0_g1_i1.p1  ORF type:complete len:561 (+),score=113.03 TRINITY_DN9318_c0_g1_i1:58-1740(+)